MLLVALLSGTAAAQTVIVSYNGFGSTSGLQLNGNAQTASGSSGQVLRLAPATTNQAGSAFTTAPVSVSGFSTAFDFLLTDLGPSNNPDDATQIGADGFTFTIQTVANTALGNSGEGLGYQGIGQSAGHSVAVEFDTWHNGDVDPPVSNGGSNHLGIDLNGSITSLATAAVGTKLDNSTKWTAWIDYNGSTLEVRVSNDGVRPATANLSQTLNLSSTLGTANAYIGFTAATGSAYENQDILDWAYSNTFVSGGISPPMAVPEPETYELLLLGAGLAGLSLWRRRLRPGCSSARRR